MLDTMLHALQPGMQEDELNSHYYPSQCNNMFIFPVSTVLLIDSTHWLREVKYCTINRLYPLAKGSRVLESYVYVGRWV
jgi:hypothetical protein